MELQKGPRKVSAIMLYVVNDEFYLIIYFFNPFSLVNSKSEVSCIYIPAFLLDCIFIFNMVSVPVEVTEMPNKDLSLDYEIEL